MGAMARSRAGVERLPIAGDGDVARSRGAVEIGHRPIGRERAVDGERLAHRSSAPALAFQSAGQRFAVQMRRLGSSLAALRKLIARIRHYRRAANPPASARLILMAAPRARIEATEDGKELAGMLDSMAETPRPEVLLGLRAVAEEATSNAAMLEKARQPDAKSRKRRSRRTRKPREVSEREAPGRSNGPQGYARARRGFDLGFPSRAQRWSGGLAAPALRALGYSFAAVRDRVPQTGETRTRRTRRRCGYPSGSCGSVAFRNSSTLV